MAKAEQVPLDQVKVVKNISETDPKEIFSALSMFDIPATSRRLMLVDEEGIIHFNAAARIAMLPEEGIGFIFMAHHTGALESNKTYGISKDNPVGGCAVENVKGVRCTGWFYMDMTKHEDASGDPEKATYTIKMNEGATRLPNTFARWGSAAANDTFIIFDGEDEATGVPEYVSPDVAFNATGLREGIDIAKIDAVLNYGGVNRALAGHAGVATNPSVTKSRKRLTHQITRGNKTRISDKFDKKTAYKTIPLIHHEITAHRVEFGKLDPDAGWRARIAEGQHALSEELGKVFDRHGESWLLWGIKSFGPSLVLGFGLFIKNTFVQFGKRLFSRQITHVVPPHLQSMVDIPIGEVYSNLMGVGLPLSEGNLPKGLVYLDPARHKIAGAEEMFACAPRELTHKELAWIAALRNLLGEVGGEVAYLGQGGEVLTSGRDQAIAATVKCANGMFYFVDFKNQTTRQLLTQQDRNIPLSTVRISKDILPMLEDGQVIVTNLKTPGDIKSIPINQCRREINELLGISDPQFGENHPLNFPDPVGYDAFKKVAHYTPTAEARHNRRVASRRLEAIKPAA